MQGAYRAAKESAKSFNPFSEETKDRYNKGDLGDATWEAWNTITGQTALRGYNKEKLKEQELIKEIQNKEIKDLNEEEKDYLRDSESNISLFIDYLFTDENKNLQKYKNNLTRQNINHELVKS